MAEHFPARRPTRPVPAWYVATCRTCRAPLTAPASRPERASHLTCPLCSKPAKVSGTSYERAWDAMLAQASWDPGSTA